MEKSSRKGLIAIKNELPLLPAATATLSVRSFGQTGPLCFALSHRKRLL